MTFIWRLYIPMTNRFRLVRIFISHGPLDGNRIGVDGVKRGRWDSTLTNRTTPRGTDRPSKGFFEIRFAMSRPWQTTISATNGSWRATSARAWAWVIGCRRTSVPAAPILTAPRCSSASASLVGRKVLWPPTLTPLRNTTSATRFPSTSRSRRYILPRRWDVRFPVGRIGVVVPWASLPPTDSSRPLCTTVFSAHTPARLSRA
jgi:hypothetical protein